MLEIKDPHDRIVEQTTRLLGYLSAVAREVGPEPLRDIAREDFLMWSREIPMHTSVQVGPSETREAWLTVRKVEKPSPPELPDELIGLIDASSIENPNATPVLLEHEVVVWIDGVVEDELPEWERDETNRIADEEPEARESLAVEKEDGELRCELRDVLRRREAARRQELLVAVEAQLKEWAGSIWSEWCERVRPTFESRHLYEKLFALALKFESEKAALEIVWGHFLFALMSPEGKRIHAPLATVTVSIEIDGDDGTIRVVPEKELQIELSAVEGAGVEGIDGLRAVQQRFAQDPIEVWAPSERQLLREQLVAPLGLDARLVNDDTQLSPNEHPQLDDGWVLLLR